MSTDEPEAPPFFRGLLWATALAVPFWVGVAWLVTR